MHWSRITPIGERPCATDACIRSARWHATSGDVGSDYCYECRNSIDTIALISAVRAVIAFDWSDNDADAVESVNHLRRVVRDWDRS